MRVSLIFLLVFLIGRIYSQEYWQQNVDYRIEVSLNDSTNFLNGFESIDYSNQSPDTLEFLIFHLWPNAYANKNSALSKQLLRMGETTMYFASYEEMGFIDSLAFTINGLPCVWQYDRHHKDICTLQLEKPLLPNTSITIETPFRVKIPSGDISRLGHIGQSFQITQWYPKPAVYDQSGWHGMPYLTIGEFYSEFGSYDVKITLPSNYTVGATGDLQTESEISRLEQLVVNTEAILKKRNQDNSWDDFSEELGFPKSSSEFKTLHYKQSKVHDFAWFADKRFHVLKGKVSLPNSKDSVVVWTMFTNKKAKLWKNSIEYMSDAIYYYSLWNGDYPYRQATAIDGTISAGGGMEYPNVTVIGDAQSAISLETVIMHEVGHNWFYGILGSNERDNAWMDEGLNSYNEQRYLSSKYPNGNLFVGNKSSRFIDRLGFSKYGMKDLHYFSYLLSARANSDQALNHSSPEFSSINYGTIVYSKSAVFFNYLRNYLGDEKMDAFMMEYFEEFKFKHPQPEDFLSILKSDSSLNLSWIEEALYTTNKVDYKIGRVRSRNGVSNLKLINKGNIASPIPVSYFRNRELVKTEWLNGFISDTTIAIVDFVDRIEIDHEMIVPEVKRSNNYSRVKGFFPRIEPIKLTLLGSIEDPRESQLFYTPILGLNEPGGFMPGLAIYNSILPVKKINFLLNPMYSVRSNEFVGFAEAYYMITPSASSFESIDLGIRVKRMLSEYRNIGSDFIFNRFEPYLRFDFRPSNYSGFWNQELVLSSVVVNQNAIEQSPVGSKEISFTDVFNRVTYSLKYKNPAFNSILLVNAEQHSSYLRASLEVVNTTLLTKMVSVRSRVFAGSFISNSSVDPKFNWRMDGQSGRNDYAFDANLLDRSNTNTVLDNQLNTTHGAFKTPTALGSSNQGLVAYNGEVKLSKIPIGVFGDMGYSASKVFVADAGFFVSFIKHTFNVYFPLVYSDNIKTEISANGRSLGDLIRFEIDFKKLNLMSLRRNLQI